MKKLFKSMLAVLALASGTQALADNAFNFNDYYGYYKYANGILIPVSKPENIDAWITPICDGQWIIVRTKLFYYGAMSPEKCCLKQDGIYEIRGSIERSIASYLADKVYNIANSVKDAAAVARAYVAESSPIDMLKTFKAEHTHVFIGTVAVATAACAGYCYAHYRSKSESKASQPDFAKYRGLYQFKNGVLTVIDSQYADRRAILPLATLVTVDDKLSARFHYKCHPSEGDEYFYGKPGDFKFAEGAYYLFNADK